MKVECEILLTPKARRNFLIEFPCLSSMMVQDRETHSSAFIPHTPKNEGRTKKRGSSQHKAMKSFELRRENTSFTFEGK